MHTRTPRRHRVVWRKSSYSQPTQSDCVEIAQIAGTIVVRDSKNPHGPKLTFTAENWAAFTVTVRAGRFNLT
jgi:hypothetical protein